MTGTYEHNIDAKGRLFLPAKLREELGSAFYLMMLGQDKCLTIYTQAKWDKFTAKFEELPSIQAKKMRALFANTVKCEPDSQGRIVVPQKLRDHAELEKESIILGMHDRAEIWSAQNWNLCEEELSQEEMAEFMEELGF
ncbi:MAG: division/cell wall cluster transcriptional repressor MraZ [Eubacteriales bacterium]